MYMTEPISTTRPRMWYCIIGWPVHYVRNKLTVKMKHNKNGMVIPSVNTEW